MYGVNAVKEKKKLLMKIQTNCGRDLLIYYIIIYLLSMRSKSKAKAKVKVEEDLSHYEEFDEQSPSISIDC